MRPGSAWTLVAGLIMVLVVFLSALLFSTSKMDSIRKDIYEVSDIKNKKITLVNVMYTSARERVLTLYRMLDMTDPFERDEILLEFMHKGAMFANARSELLNMPLDGKEKLILQEQGQLAGIVTPQLENLISLIQDEEFDKAREILNRHSIKVQTSLLSKLEILIEHMQENSNKAVNYTDRKLDQNKKLIYTWAVIAFLAGLLIAFYIIKCISNAERKLHVQMENTRSTLSSISDGVVTIEEDGGIKYMNKMAVDLIGESSDEKPIWECIRFLNIEYKQAFKQMLRMSKQKDAVDLGQYEVSNNGKQRWLDIYRSPVYDQNNELLGIVLVLRDVTELKATQLELFKSNESLERRVNERTQDIKQGNLKLQESIRELKLAQNKLVQTEKMAALGGLVAGISHEINTPIGTSVTSATSIEENFIAIESQFNDGVLTQDNFSNFLSHTKEGLDILTKNLRRASELIRSFKLIAVDQTSEEWREIDIKEYTYEIITSLRPRLKSTQVKIDVNIPENLVLHTNPGAIYQIISNLILNSVIHGFSENDTVNTTQKPATITLDINSDGDYMRIFYMDNGKGMDEITLSKVFDPFFTTRRGQGGSGLGMNIVFNVVTSQLNGVVTVDSSPDNGIYLEMLIPVSQENEVHYVNKQQSII